MRERGASLTARWVAAQRIRLHGSRPSTATGDIDAERRLYAGFGVGFLLPGMAPTGMTVRTRFVDAEVVGAIARGVEQIALVGAGYDGRALRFRTPGVRWIEIDHPATQRDKRRRLDALGVDVSHVTFVPVDLLRDDVDAALDRARLSGERPALFVCEGLFSYLPLDATTSLCRRLRARSGDGSVLAANFLVVPAAAGRVGTTLRRAVDGILSLIGERRLATFRPGDPERVLADTGWHPVRRDESKGARDAGHLVLLAAER